MGSVNREISGVTSQRGGVPGYDLDKDGPSDGLTPEQINELKMRMPDGPTREDFKSRAYRARFGRRRNGEL